MPNLPSDLLIPLFDDPNEGFEAPINVNQQSVAAAGFYPQNATSADKNAGIYRDTNGNLVLKDAISGIKTLAQIASGSGSLTFAAPSTIGTSNTEGIATSVARSDHVHALPTAGTAGTYGSGSQVPVLVTDAYGRVTAVTNTNISITSSGVSDFSSSVKTVLAASVAAGTGIGTSVNQSTGVITISNSGVTSVNDGTGAITNVALTTGKLSQFAATTSSELAGVVSDETGSGSLVFGTAPTLAQVVLSAGTTTTVPLKFTSGTNLTASVAGAVEWDGTSLYLTQTTGPTRKTVAYLDSSITGNAATATKLAASKTFALTGDVTGSASTDLASGPSIASTLASVGTAGTYGSASQVPVLTTDAKGRVTGVTGTTISITSGNVSDFSNTVKSVLGMSIAAGTGIGTSVGAGGTVTISNSGVLSVNMNTGHVAGIAVTSGKLSQFAATSSSELAGVISDETGSGALVFASAPTMSQVTLSAGTTTVAPLKFTSGTNLTSAAAGAVEWDGTSLYLTQTTGPTRKTVAYTDSSITGNAATATALSASKTFALTGDVTGSASTDLSTGPSISTTLASVGTAGTYGSASAVPVLTTDAKGRVTGVTSTSIAIAQGAVTNLTTDLAGKASTATTISAGTGLSGGGDLSTNRTISMPSVGTAGTYGSASSVPVLTTDAQGRVSGVTATSIAIAQSAVTGLTTDLAAKAADNAVVHLTGNESVGGIKTFSLSPSIPTPSASGDAANKSYVDSQVSAVSGSYAAPVQDVTALRALTSTGLTDKQLRLVEDKGALYRYDTAGTGSDDGDGTLTPTDNPATGRWYKVQAATQAHNSLSGLQGGTTNDYQHLTTAQLGTLTGATNLNTASAIVKRDASGNFTAGTVTAALTGNASTATALSTARTFALTGDVTGTVSSDLTTGASIATTFASVGAAGTYGSASQVPVLTTDAKGRVTGVTNTSIAIAQAAVTNLTTDLAAKAITAGKLSQFAATSSSELAGVISDETGSGSLVFANAPTMSQVTLSAGTTTVAPLKFTSGTNLTSAAAGAVEWDGTSLYLTQTTGPTRKTVAYTDSSITGNAATATKLAASKTFALTGDVTGSTSTDLTTGPSIAATLASVGTAGTYGSASQVPVLTTDAKGRITGATNTSIAIAQAAVTSLTSDLSARPTGSGTAGHVAYWSGTSALTGESNLYWDATNDRLGIGTSSPLSAFKLDVAGMERNAGLVVDYGGILGFNLYYSGGWKYAGNGYGSTWVSNNTGGMDLYTAGNNTGGAGAGASLSGPLVTFANGGNVSIGTASPRTALHAYGTSNTPSASGSTEKGIFIVEGSATNAIKMGTDPSSPYGVWIQGLDKTNNTTQYPLLLNPVGGNVGIGKTSPGAKLDVEGFSTYRGNSYVMAAFSANSTLAPLNIVQHTDGTNPGISAGQNSSAVWQDLTFLTSNTERLRIAPGGNVGIGTTSTFPNTLLNVQQGIAASGNNTVAPWFQSYHSGATTDKKTWRWGGDSSGDWNIQTVNDAYSSATTRLTITSGGNVGIGTASPLANLSVSTGDSRKQFTVDLSADPVIKIGTPDWYNIGEIAFVTGSGGERMRISSGGNVGIGTTSPGDRLSVVGGGISSSSTGNAYLVLDSGTGGAAGNQISYIDVKLNGTLKANIAVNEGVSGNPLEINSATSGNVSLVTGGGNVGIGTASPNARLGVSSTGYPAAQIESTYVSVGKTYSALQLGPLAANQGTALGWAYNSATPANSFFFITPYGSVEGNQFAVSASGGVGIGTPTPGTKLQIGSAATDGNLLRLGIVYDGASSARGGLEWNDSVATTARIWSEFDGTSTSLRFGSLYNSGYTTNTAMTVRGTGLVGIGTTSPAAGLHISGTDSTVSPRMRLQNTTATTGNTWQVTSGNDGKLYFTRPTVVDALIVDGSGNVTVNGNIVFGSTSNGINFGAAGGSGTSNTSNLFDDYEVGTWAPQLWSSVSVSIAVSYARYVKVGKLVTAQCQFTVSNTGGTGNASIRNLPFTSSASTFGSVQCDTYSGMSSISSAFGGYVDLSATIAYPYKNATTANAAMVIGDFPVNAQVKLTIIYQAA